MIKVFSTESAAYRAGQNIDDAIEAFSANGMDAATARLKSFEQFAIECALLKVNGSEMLDYVADETVQIFGGMGYSAEAPAERHYRDARINRIFEGTNEINRMLCLGTLVKRALKGELDLMSPALAVQQELINGQARPAIGPDLFDYEVDLVKRLKKATLMMIGGTAQQIGPQLKSEQEVTISLADMLIQAYVAESTLLRVMKLVERNGAEAHSLHIDILRTFLQEAADAIYQSGKDAANAFAEGDMYKGLMKGLRVYTETEAFNAKEARRRIADHLIKENKYDF